MATPSRSPASVTRRRPGQGHGRGHRGHARRGRHVHRDHHGRPRHRDHRDPRDRQRRPRRARRPRGARRQRSHRPTARPPRRVGARAGVAALTRDRHRGRDRRRSSIDFTAVAQAHEPGLQQRRLPRRRDQHHERRARRLGVALAPEDRQLGDRRHDRRTSSSSCRADFKVACIGGSTTITRQVDEGAHPRRPRRRRSRAARSRRPCPRPRSRSTTSRRCRRRAERDREPAQGPGAHRRRRTRSPSAIKSKVPPLANNALAGLAREAGLPPTCSATRHVDPSRRPRSRSRRASCSSASRPSSGHRRRRRHLPRRTPPRSRRPCSRAARASASRSTTTSSTSCSRGLWAADAFDLSLPINTIPASRRPPRRRRAHARAQALAAADRHDRGRRPLARARRRDHHGPRRLGRRAPQIALSIKHDARRRSRASREDPADRRHARRSTRRSSSRPTASRPAHRLAGRGARHQRVGPRRRQAGTRSASCRCRRSPASRSARRPSKGAERSSPPTSRSM